MACLSGVKALAAHRWYTESVPRYHALYAVVHVQPASHFSLESNDLSALTGPSCSLEHLPAARDKQNTPTKIHSHTQNDIVLQSNADQQTVTVL